MISFRDWLLTRESSAATRLRWDAAMGLKPPIPDASIHSHSTAPMWQVERLKGKGNKKRKKKKRKNNIKRK
jgi:hypothetical protein